MWKTDTGRPVRIAKVLRPHGVRGAVLLGVDQSLRETVVPGLEIDIEDIGSFTVESASPHKTGLLVQFREMNDRDDAERASGRWASVPRKTLPDTAAGQYYDFELVGAEVKSAADGSTLGTVREVIATGANDVYRVEGPAGELLIPAVEGVVIEVDTETGTVTVDPAGLVSPDAQ